MAFMSFALFTPAYAGEIPEDSGPYYSGLGIAISFCTGCHDVGPAGPRDQFSRAPSFEKVMQKFDPNNANLVAEVKEFLVSMKDSKSRSQRMPPLGLSDSEIEWLAIYLSYSDF